MDLKIFIDSDVVISSLISSKGAAHTLIHETNIKSFISNKSIEEIKRVAQELNIDDKPVKEVIEKKFSITKIRDSIKKIKEYYKEYVKDSNDAHIVAGAHLANVKFIISYNQKDYNSEKIKENLNIIMMTPAKFLQYLRSLE